MRVIGKFKDLGKSLGTSSSGLEEVYLCPYCITVIGKPDTSGKLYYNKKKRVGHCFKCDSLVFNTEIPDISELAEEWLSILSPTQAEDSTDSTSLFDLSWTKPVSEIPQVYEYLINRNINDQLIDRYNLLATDFPILGVVIPNVMTGKYTDYYQIRDIKQDSYIKYRNPVSTSKPVYGIGFIGDNKSIIITEGVFSAISASRIPGCAGLATYGKSLKLDQLNQIKSLNSVDNIYVMYDGGTLGPTIKAANMLLKTGRDVYVTLLPWSKDPNELSDEGIRICFDTNTYKYQSPDYGNLLWKIYNYNSSKYTSKLYQWRSLIKTLNMENSI